MATDVQTVFENTYATAQQLLIDMDNAVQTASAALQTLSLEYTPFDFQMPIMTFGSPTGLSTPPAPPLAPNLDNPPTVQAIPTEMPQAPGTFSKTVASAPSVTIPNAPSVSITPRSSRSASAY